MRTRESSIHHSPEFLDLLKMSDAELRATGEYGDRIISREFGYIMEQCRYYERQYVERMLELGIDLREKFGLLPDESPLVGLLAEPSVERVEIQRKFSEPEASQDQPREDCL